MSVNELLEHASTIRPCQGERVSGDAVIICPLEHGLLVAIVDVLGHGQEAHELTHVIDSYLARFAKKLFSRRINKVCMQMPSASAERNRLVEVGSR